MINNLPVAKVAIPLPIDKLFDYHIPKSMRSIIRPGVRARIKFNDKIIIGYVVSLNSKSLFSKLNSIIEIDQQPILSTNLLKLAEKIKDYYVCSLGEAIDIFLPNAIKRFMDIKLKPDVAFLANNKVSEDAKKNKIEYVQTNSSEILLGKINEEIINITNNKRRVVFVVPEINKINTIVEYFQKNINLKIGVWHGGVPKVKIVKLLQDLADDSIDLIVGTRSCLFAPIPNLGLIVIKDENNFSYKDDQSPYYHALNIAKMRSEIDNCKLIINSILPSTNLFSLFSKKEIKKVGAVENKLNPSIEIVEPNFKNKINPIIETVINSSLDNKSKILIFLNKKGFSNYIYCKECNEVLRCSRCSAGLRFSHSDDHFACPVCNAKFEAKEICPKCNISYVKHGGWGIEKLESDFKRYFPQAKIVTIEKINKDVINSGFDILISSRNISDIGDFSVDLTIVWDFDSLVNISDFRSGENTYRLLLELLQITVKKLIICTSLNSNFYLFNHFKNLDYDKFIESELKSRRQLKMPPYFHIALISIRSFSKELAQKSGDKLFSLLKKTNSNKNDISYFNSTQKSRIRGKFYKYISVKSSSVKTLNKIIRQPLGAIRSSNVIVTVNVDPL
jgi:primosomal protein N' (replication factor Y)